MPFMSKSKGDAGCAACKVVSGLVGLLLLATSIAAVMGAYTAHFAAGGATFGTTTGSLSLIALAINATLFAKTMKCCCGCMKK